MPDPVPEHRPRHVRLWHVIHQTTNEVITAWNAGWEYAFEDPGTPTSYMLGDDGPERKAFIEGFNSAMASTQRVIDRMPES